MTDIGTDNLTYYGEWMRKEAIDAFQHKCGLWVDVEPNGIPTSMKRSLYVPLGQIWTSAGGQFVAPSSWQA